MRSNSRFCDAVLLWNFLQNISNTSHTEQGAGQTRKAHSRPTGRAHSVVRCMAGNRKAFLFCGSNSGESAADLVRIAVEGVELLGNLLFQHEAEVGVIHRVGVRVLRLCRLGLTARRCPKTYRMEVSEEASDDVSEVSEVSDVSVSSAFSRKPISVRISCSVISSLSAFSATNSSTAFLSSASHSASTVHRELRDLCQNLFLKGRQHSVVVIGGDQRFQVGCELAARKQRGQLVLILCGFGDGVQLVASSVSRRRLN